MPTKPLVRRVKPAIYDDSDEEDDLESGEGEGCSDGDIDGLSAGTDEMDDEENSEEYDGDDGDDDETTTTAAAAIGSTAALSRASFSTLARYELSPPHTKQAKAGRPFSAAAAAVVVKPQVQQVAPTRRHPGNVVNDPTSASSAQAQAQAQRRPRRSSPLPKRSSKSAPAEQSSKKPVPRFREAVETSAPKARDPRFDPASGAVNERQLAKNYAFLNDYKDKEMDVLRGEIEKLKRKRVKGAAIATATTTTTAPTDNDREGELLRNTERKLKSMESQKKTKESKERVAFLIAEHKKRERQLVKQGKAPYFLKQSEQKQMLLMDKYSKLGERDLDRVIERRRKRNAAKQRKNMPWARRDAA